MGYRYFTTATSSKDLRSARYSAKGELKGCTSLLVAFAHHHLNQVKSWGTPQTELAALAPDIDRLINCFPDEWGSFMRSLPSSQRKELRKYLWYRKNPRSDWSFPPATASTIQVLNEQARCLYWYGGIRYKQLSLPMSAIAPPNTKPRSLH